MNELQTSTDRVEQSEKLAFKIKDAAAQISVCERTMHNLIKRRKIYPTRTLRLVTKEELLRYLREETDLTKRSRNFQTSHQRAAA